MSDRRDHHIDQTVDQVNQASLFKREITMAIDLPIDSMSISEKLQVVELVWDSIRRSSDEVPSPDWHAELLKERSQRLANGEATVSHWEDAKRRLNELGQ